MSMVSKIDKELEITYRSHTIVREGKQQICKDCQMNIWSEDFPEFCIGPTTILNLGKVSSSEEIYNLDSKIFHLHSKTLIGFRPPLKLSDGFSLELTKNELTSFIDKLQNILNSMKDFHESDG